jgi:hypothetical protein
MIASILIVLVVYLFWRGFLYSPVFAALRRWMIRRRWRRTLQRIHQDNLYGKANAYPDDKG